MRPSTKAALTRFDSAAQNWGWQKDQGTGSSVTSSGNEYNAARVSLERAIDRESKPLPNQGWTTVVYNGRMYGVGRGVWEICQGGPGQPNLAGDQVRDPALVRMIRRFGLRVTVHEKKA